MPGYITWGLTAIFGLISLWFIAYVVREALRKLRKLCRPSHPAVTRIPW
jgi:hypothetical protein